MIKLLPEVSENIYLLAADDACAEPMREQAETIRDLLELAATWPVPPSLNLDEDISMRVAGLCRSSGFALCRTQPCERAGRARCTAVIS